MIPRFPSTQPPEWFAEEPDEAASPTITELRLETDHLIVQLNQYYEEIGVDSTFHQMLLGVLTNIHQRLVWLEQWQVGGEE